MNDVNTLKALKLQLEIGKIADVWYECYYEKIKFSQFWQKFVWDKLLLEKMLCTKVTLVHKQ
jgi:hypothetical protein